MCGVYMWCMCGVHVSECVCVYVFLFRVRLDLLQVGKFCFNVTLNYRKTLLLENNLNIRQIGFHICYTDVCV